MVVVGTLYTYLRGIGHDTPASARRLRFSQLFSNRGVPTAQYRYEGFNMRFGSRDIQELFYSYKQTSYEYTNTIIGDLTQNTHLERVKERKRKVLTLCSRLFA